MTSTGWAQTAVVSGPDAFLRGTPTDAGAVVDTLAIGSKVLVIKEEGNWLLVQSSPFVGWMHASLLKIAEVPDSDPEQQMATTRLERDQNAPESATQPASDPPTTAEPGQRVYKRGPRGGCYYIQASGKKTYVAHRLCSSEDKTNSARNSQP
jgi:mannosyl-glycoprotein endo-beta-N-acetylglucosaminidase